MRRLPLLFVFVVMFLGIAGTQTADAAIVWATGAVIDSQSAGIIEDRPISRATAAPNKERYIAHTLGGTETVQATWTFANPRPGSAPFWLVFDDINGNLTAAVTAYNSTSVSGTTVTIPDPSYQDYFVLLPFNHPVTSTSISTVTVLFTFTGAAEIYLDTFASPEPGTLALFGAGLLGLGVWVRRRKKQKRS
jgi:PEP-CTERM motif